MLYAELEKRLEKDIVVSSNVVINIYLDRYGIIVNKLNIVVRIF